MKLLCFDFQSPKESAHTASFCSKTVDQILQNASQVGIARQYGLMNCIF